MSENKIDYEKLGLKIGLEIHQQLETGKKLFCNCPSLLRKDEPDFIIKRKLHVVPGESGEVDVAARHEAEKTKEFIYEGYNTTCLVELDESPPYKINEKALKIALQIALLLNCKVLPISQIMRKTVIDGSNTSGFQRTVVIAENGWIDSSFGKVEIQSICLEEDAARIIEKKDKEVIYRLDRLGIPLIEISTMPDIKTPLQAKQVALKIGEILRNCEVKRGIGTIRQDINLSIKGGKRVEIKGFQDVRNIERAIKIEVKRQMDLAKKGKSVGEVRNVLPDGTTNFLRPLPGAARMYPETDLTLLKISRNFLDNVKKTLPALKSELKEELRKKGLHEELIKLILKKNKIEEIKSLSLLYHDLNLIAKMLVLWPEEIAKKSGKKVNEKLNIDVLETILQLIKKGKIFPWEVKEIMIGIAKGKTLKEIEKEKLKKEKIENINFIEEKILKIIKSKPGLSINAYMGLVMNEPELKGKISGKEAMEILKRLIK